MLNKIGDIFPYKSKSWKITETFPTFITKDGKKVESDSICIGCRNVLNNGGEGKYYLKISFYPKNWKLPSTLNPHNASMGYFEKQVRSHQPVFGGEYDNVCKYTTQYDNLKHAHCSPITIDESKEVLKLLCKKFNISYKKGVWKFSSRVTRGWGGLKNKKPYFSVPNKTLQEYGYKYGYLRVGLILHEFAHVLHRSRRKQADQSHGRNYITILDRVVKYYYETIAFNIESN